MNSVRLIYLLHIYGHIWYIWLTGIKPQVYTGSHAAHLFVFHVQETAGWVATMANSVLIS